LCVCFLACLLACFWDLVLVMSNNNNSLQISQYTQLCVFLLAWIWICFLQSTTTTTTTLSKYHKA
jgi:hypothetical protein